MLSQTPGETHIAAQFKESLAVAQERGWAGNMMQDWVSSLLHVSKHIQTEVTPLLHKEEIEGMALSYLDAHVPDLSDKTILILGAGMVGTGLVQGAIPKVACSEQGRGGKIIWCYHKNKPASFQSLAEKMGTGSVCLCTFNDIKDRIGEADIIISATEAPGYVLHSGHAPFVDQEKKIILIDLGMPRNIDPALTGLSPELTLVDLDGLKHWHLREGADLDDVFNKCRQLIAEHMEQYERITNSFQSRSEG
jgi:glutamyl-tRNA reductase